jgi:hypothetical protein
MNALQQEFLEEKTELQNGAKLATQKLQNEVK